MTRRASRAADDTAYELTAEARESLEGWRALQASLASSYSGAILVFCFGCLAGPTLLTLYLCADSYADSFKTDALAQRSFESSIIAVGAMISPAALNSISQVPRPIRHW